MFGSCFFVGVLCLFFCFCRGCLFLVVVFVVALCLVLVFVEGFCLALVFL